MPTSFKDMGVVGIIEPVSVEGVTTDILAKIDTGADSSSIWASSIHVNQEGILQFTLFDKDDPHYTGEVIERKDYTASLVRSSNGASEVRYKAQFTVRVEKRRIKVKFNLSDRSKNTYKVLIGRRSISGKFLVDVSKGRSLLPKPKITDALNSELIENPHEFHAKYVNKGA